MAARIPVQLSRNPYEVIVGHDLLRRAGEFVSQILPKGKCAIVTDTNVGPLYAEQVRESLLAQGFEVTVVEIPAGEPSKSMEVAEEVCDSLITAGLDRNSFLVGLGGGVVGDLSGFVAAIYYRGIPHVQIPTSVVAQVDSAVGGKTGINSRLGKNLIGAFHQPTLVIADTVTLETLPKREFNEGLAEIIKHAAIRDGEMLEDLTDITPQTLPALISRNVKIKALIVVEDEFERHGLRALLNFGHTIGHAIENSAGYGRFLHGEAISLGLAAALYLSEKKGGLDPADSARILDLLKSFDLPTRLPDDLTTDQLVAALSRDKKFEGGEVRFVLVPALGSAHVSKELTLDDLREAIEHLRK